MEFETAEPLKGLNEKMDYWEQIGELCEKYEYPTILEWREKAEKYDEIMTKKKKENMHLNILE